MCNKHCDLLESSRQIVQNLGHLIGRVENTDVSPCVKRLGRTYQGLLKEHNSIEALVLTNDLNGQRKAFRRLCVKAERIFRIIGSSETWHH